MASGKAAEEDIGELAPLVLAAPPKLDSIPAIGVSLKPDGIPLTLKANLGKHTPRTIPAGPCFPHKDP